MSNIDWSSVARKLALSLAKYEFYDGSFNYPDFESSKIASSLPHTRVGWGRRAVDMRSNKTKFDKFENDTIGLNETFDYYHARQAFNKIKSDIAVCGVGFLALAGDRVMPFTALEATGTYDWREQNLKDGIAVFQKNTKKSASSQITPDSYMEFSAAETASYQDGKLSTVKNVTGRPLMTLLTYNATTKQPFGRSVISRTACDAIVSASRTVRQAEIAGYHYNTKIDVILGTDSETSIDTMPTKTGDIVKLGVNGNGQIPQIGEFAQHAMAPFNDTLLMHAKNFCADTKLSLANLGVAQNAPQSPEALEIVGDDLRDDIQDWQDELSEQLKYFAVTLWMNKNNVSQIDDNLRAKIDAINVAWLPVFKPDISKFGDGLNKIAADAPDIVKARSIWRSAGLSSDEIDIVIASALANQTTNPKS